MLIELWLAITWLLYGSRREYLPDQQGNGAIRSSCPYVCAVGDSIMKNLFDTNLPINSTGDLHARCGVTKFLIKDCWNETKYGTDCLPQRHGLMEEVIQFSDKNCTESFYEVTEEPCFWRWSHQENRCSNEYFNFVTHLVGSNRLNLSPLNQKVICCDFLRFQECAVSATTGSCSDEVKDFVQRFFYKLAGQSAVDRCNNQSVKTEFVRRCEATRKPLRLSHLN